MRYFVCLMAGLVLLSGCKKKVEDLQLDALMALITNGQWQVTKFEKDNITLTAEFASFSFQFKKDGTVDAIKNGLVEKTGTWVGHATDRTIQSSFGTAPEPLSLLNGTWYVTNTSTTFVEASQQSNGATRILRLDKL